MSAVALCSAHGTCRSRCGAAGGSRRFAPRGRTHPGRRRAEQQRPGALQEWDIVLYDDPAGGGAALGRVSSVAGGEVAVERLEEDAANAVWLVAHGAEQRLPLSAVRRTLQADYLQLVDPDRVSNPHGEHAIEAFRLLDPAEAAAVRAAQQH